MNINEFCFVQITECLYLIIFIVFLECIHEVKYSINRKLLKVHFNETFCAILIYPSFVTLSYG